MHFWSIPRLRSRSCPGAYSPYLVARPVSTGGLVGASLWTQVTSGGLVPARGGPRGASGVQGSAKDGFL